MNNLTQGDIVYTKHTRELVVAKIDGIVFLCIINTDGSRGAAKHYLIEDLISWGYKKEN